MPEKHKRWPAILALVAAALGLVFAAYSTSDYAAHLDRQADHVVHCSLIPGMAAGEQLDNPCRTALYSAYSAILREKWWGGVPISLFALGSFGFWTAFALYLALLGPKAPRRAHQFFVASTAPALVATIVMFTISATKLGTFCKVCVGIYLSSIVMAASAALALRQSMRAAPVSREPSILAPIGWLAALGAASLLPAVVYVSALPSYSAQLTTCQNGAGGKLKVAKEPHNALVKLSTPQAVRQATLFVDPLCPTCKAFHERLVAEEVIDRLDAQLVLFPLDSDCNWMLDTAIHPGACVLSRAVLCAKSPRDMLDWAFANQDALKYAAIGGKDKLKAKLAAQWGQDLVACTDQKDTQIRLNRHLQFAVANQVQVSTPQMFLGDARLCDEDTDLGLRYALSQLAPEVLR